MGVKKGGQHQIYALLLVDCLVDARWRWLWLWTVIIERGTTELATKVQGYTLTGMWSGWMENDGMGVVGCMYGGGVELAPYTVLYCTHCQQHTLVCELQY